jgi:hypothetical protein
MMMFSNGQPLTFKTFRTQEKEINQSYRLKRLRKLFPQWIKRWVDTETKRAHGHRTEGTLEQGNNLLKSRYSRRTICGEQLTCSDGSPLQQGSKLYMFNCPIEITGAKQVDGIPHLAARHVERKMLMLEIPKQNLTDSGAGSGAGSDTDFDEDEAGSDTKKTVWFPASLLFTATREANNARGFGDQVIDDQEWAELKSKSKTEIVEAAQDGEKGNKAKSPAEVSGTYVDVQTHQSRSSQEKIEAAIMNTSFTHTNYPGNSILGKIGARNRLATDAVPASTTIADTNASASMSRANKKLKAPETYHACDRNNPNCAAGTDHFQTSLHAQKGLPRPPSSPQVPPGQLLSAN